ncbi:MAG: DUF1207 domain-containing protein [Myxococcota bacterium]
MPGIRPILVAIGLLAIAGASDARGATPGDPRPGPEAAAPESAADEIAEKRDVDLESARVETAFVEGYATHLLESSLALRDFDVHFAPPTLEAHFAEGSKLPLDKIAASLLQLSGVERVRLFSGDRLVLEEMDADALPSEGSPAGSEARPGTEATVAVAEREIAVDPRITRKTSWELFPGNEMFEPLIADPRWPRFSAAYQSYLDDDELSGVGAANFGETFSLIRSPERPWGQWELAIQPGVFAVFDLEASSFDLVNSDYLAGLIASHHYADLTTQIRIYHQSSHLGDEYLLRNRVDRVNLSFEVLDVLVSFEPWRWLRLYGGGGVILHREPALERGLLQGGVEISSPRAFANGYLRPVAALDVQSREESDWAPDFSLRAGVQIEHPALEDRRVRLLGEFYDGRSPNGQFFERDIRTVGIGLALGF